MTPLMSRLLIAAAVTLPVLIAAVLYQRWLDRK
jgi:hypothetical protein